MSALLFDVTAGWRPSRTSERMDEIDDGAKSGGGAGCRKSQVRVPS